MTSYLSGDRRSRINVSTSLAISHGSIANWVNGSDAQDGSGSFFPKAVTDNTGARITFDLAAPVLIDEARVRQGGSSTVLNVTRGSWQWQGYDGAGWVNIGSPFVLGGSPSQVLTELNCNATTYQRYSLLGVGGSISDSGWMIEIEFREGIAVEAAPVAPYADPQAVPSGDWVFNSPYPIELVSQIPNVAYVSDPPPYMHVAKSRDILDCQPGDYIEADLVQEATWDFPPNNCEWAGMLMLRKISDVGSVTLSNAGPLIDYRCMTENPGKNILVAEHHAMMTLLGATTVQAAGDYRVDYLTYASTGNIAASGHLKMHDGTLRVRRYRSTPKPG